MYVVIFATQVCVGCDFSDNKGAYFFLKTYKFLLLKSKDNFLGKYSHWRFSDILSLYLAMKKPQNLPNNARVNLSIEIRNSV